MIIPGWLIFLEPNSTKKSVDSLLGSILDESRGSIYIAYYGFTTGTIETKSGRILESEEIQIPVLMANTGGGSEIEQLSNEGLIRSDMTIKLEDLDEIYVYNTFDKGLIIENIEYLDYYDFINRLRR